jgi:uncharacterized membrane protein
MRKYFPLFIIVASFLISILLYPQLTERMASHWGLYGEVNGYMNKFWGSFFMPFLSIGMYFLFLIIPKIDPKAKNIDKFRNHFDNFINSLFIFLFYIHLLTLVWNLGYQFNLLAFIAPAFSLLFYNVGILVEKAEPNWTIGVRNPWTLSNEKVWDKTHKLTGKMFKIVAIITLFGVLFPMYGLIFLTVGVISVAVFSFIYSYWEYKKLI